MVFPTFQHDQASECAATDYAKAVFYARQDSDDAKSSELDTLHSTESPQPEDENTVERGVWTSPFDFLMSLIAYCVGLGNVWRFPYLCFKNGGGAFLIPYAICWCLAAVPAFFLEVSTGQYLHRGGISIWELCPIFKGAGIAAIVISTYCNIYYCVIVVWALYHIFSAFQRVLPWIHCGHWWNDIRCQELDFNATNVNKSAWLISLIEAGYSRNETETPVEQFWENKVLRTTDNLGNSGNVQWQLALLLILSWVICYFALWKGIINARKLVYFCALSPYVIMLVLLIRGATLEGAGDGIMFFLKPNMTKLKESVVWKDAGTQVFYSYGIGFGVLTALGSYNKFHHNCLRDTFVICAINVGTSLLGGFVVFSVLGFMAHKAGKLVGDVVKSGVGLAFLVYPEVVAYMPISQLWAVLFFTMIAILGLDSQMCSIEGVVTALCDVFPVLLKRKQLFVLGMCIVSFLLGLPMVTQAGQHWLTLVDGFGPSGFTLLIAVFTEVVGLAWGFGAENVYKNLEAMLGYRPSRIWLYLWKYVTPTVIIALFLLISIMYEPLEYPDKRPFPGWAQAIGFLITTSSIIVIPVNAIYQVWYAPGESLKEKFRNSFKPRVAIANTPRQTDGLVPLETKELI